jgi:hypothetical protein
MSRKRMRSEIEVYIHGGSLLICEYFSRGFMEKLVEHAEKNYGLILVKKCRSLCG